VADPAATKAVLGGLGYRYAWDPRMSQYAHIAAYAVLAPDGRLGGWVYGLAPAPDALAKALADARSGRTSLAQQFLLLCYHFAPLTGRYDPAVDAAMRIAGLATAAALAAFVALALWRERRPRGAR
jgi:protein SCO1/2